MTRKTLRKIFQNTLLAAVVALLPASLAAAEPSADQKPDKPTGSTKLLPLKGTGTGNPCAAYGAGFVRVEGTETCVKIGGAVSIGVGGSSGAR
jgi:Porin subfamily